MTKTRIAKIAVAGAYAMIPPVLAVWGWIERDPYLFAIGLVLVVWQGIVYLADKIVNAIESSSLDAAEKITRSIEQPFAQKLNDALGVAGLRPFGRD